MSAMLTTVASSVGFSDQSIFWILNAYTYSNQAAEEEVNAGD